MDRAPEPSRFASDPKIWVFSTYFTEGFPYMVVRTMSSVFFTDIGMSERFLGYLNFLGLPWNLKFLWAPAVDIFGNKRTWMTLVQAAITLLTALVAVLCFAAAEGMDPVFATTTLVWIFVVLALIAATNDVVIDGYYMDGLTDPKEQAANTGYRVMAYRLAMILARFGIILAVAEMARGAATRRYVSRLGLGLRGGRGGDGGLHPVPYLRAAAYRPARAQGREHAGGGPGVPEFVRVLSGDLAAALPDRSHQCTDRRVGSMARTAPGRPARSPVLRLCVRGHAVRAARTSAAPGRPEPDLYRLLQDRRRDHLFHGHALSQALSAGRQRTACLDERADRTRRVHRRYHHRGPVDQAHGPAQGDLAPDAS